MSVCITKHNSSLQPSSEVLRNLLQNTNISKTVEEKVNFMKSSHNKGLSSTCIALSFNTFSSISWYSICFFFQLCYSFHILFPDFKLFRSEYHWRDVNCRNAYLVHQNWYDSSFMFLHISKNTALTVCVYQRTHHNGSVFRKRFIHSPHLWEWSCNSKINK